MGRIGLFLLSGVAAVVVCGCSDKPGYGPAPTTNKPPPPMVGQGGWATAPREAPSKDIPGPDWGGAPTAAPPATAVPKPAPAPPVDRPPAAAEAIAGAGKSSRHAADSKGPQSGILTAGSFDDNLEPQFFRSFLDRMAQQSPVGDLPGRLRGQRLIVTVKGANDRPVGNARVRVAPAGGGNGVELISRSDGRVVVVAGWDQVAAGSDFAVTVTPPDGGPVVTQKVLPGVPTWEVVLPQAQGAPPQNLDLAIILDTTGSMGDELEYLKSEIKSIAAAVHDKFPQVSQRYALVCYRDDGDEYLTRPFNFTASIDDFRRNLGKQSAGGGGDYPEAMHRGLEEAVQLGWREGNTARVLFLVADAPPHAQFVGRTMAAADALRKKGVAVYPVACSGYDDAAEMVMRGCALLTGSQFLFLTDDSGVGGAHGEPHTPFYHVQRLDRLVVRMIASELSGKRIAPERGEIIRTVGKPIN